MTPEPNPSPTPPSRGEHADVRLSRYVDGLCSPAEAREVEAALAADPALADEVRAWRDAAAALRADRAAPRADLADRVIAGLSAGPREDALFQRIARRYAAAAAVLLAVGLGGTAFARAATAAKVTKGAADAPRPVDETFEDARVAREARAVLDDDFRPATKDK
jgi:anti-sigma factor RsiW